MNTIYIDYQGEYIASCNVEGNRRHLARDNDLEFVKVKAMKHYYGFRWKEHKHETKFVEIYEQNQIR